MFRAAAIPPSRADSPSVAIDPECVADRVIGVFSPPGRTTFGPGLGQPSATASAGGGTAFGSSATT